MPAQGVLRFTADMYCQTTLTRTRASIAQVFTPTALCKVFCQTVCTCVQAIATEGHATYSAHAVIVKHTSKQVGNWLKSVQIQHSPPRALGKHGSTLLQGSTLGRVWSKFLQNSLHSINTSHVHLHYRSCKRLAGAGGEFCETSGGQSFTEAPQECTHIRMNF